MLCVGGPLHGEEVEAEGLTLVVPRKTEDRLENGIYRIAPVFQENDSACQLVAGLWAGWERAY